MAQGRLRGDTISSTKSLLRRTGVLLAMTMGVNVILSEATGFAQGRFQGDAISSTKRLLRRTGVLLAMTMGVNVIESYVVGKSLPQESRPEFARSKWSTPRVLGLRGAYHPKN